MLRNLRISGFRGLREFAMSGLGRVNLLVGTNNCGKTSVLEAIHALSAAGSAAPLWLAQVRRGELIDNANDRQVDVTHLIHGHRIAMGSSFRIAGDASTGQRALVVEFVARKMEPRAANGNGHDDEDDERDIGSPGVLLPPLSLRLHWTGVPEHKKVVLTISRQGGLSLGRVLSSDESTRSEQLGSLVLITTEGLPRNEIITMFESIVLTPSEDAVVRALQALEPSIE